LTAALSHLVFDYDEQQKLSYKNIQCLYEEVFLLEMDASLKTPVINALTERTAIDATWKQCMIVATMIIQLFGQPLVISSTKDVSLRAFWPGRKFT